MNNYTKEDFKNIWKDTTKDNILNQFYYEHLELEQLKKQKDDVVDYLDKLNNMTQYDFDNEYWMQNILRMLGETDEI